MREQVYFGPIVDCFWTLSKSTKIFSKVSLSWAYMVQVWRKLTILKTFFPLLFFVCSFSTCFRDKGKSLKILGIRGCQIGMQGPPALRIASSFLQIRCGNFQNGLFRPYPTCSTSCHFKFKQLRVLCSTKLHLWHPLQYIQSKKVSGRFR